MGPCAVPAHALHGDEKAVGCGRRRPACEAQDAQRQLARGVNAVDLRRGKALEEPVLDHGACARIAFFAGLNDDDDVALEVLAPLDERRCGEKQARDVAVVPAAVHAVGKNGSPGETRLFLKGKRVHVGAKRNGERLPGRTRAAADQGDDARLAHAFLDRVAADLAKDPCGDAGGADFAKAEFGVCVEVAAKRRHFFDAGEDLRENVLVEFQHVQAPSFLRRGSMARWLRSVMKLMTTNKSAMKVR